MPTLARKYHHFRLMLIVSRKRLDKCGCHAYFGEEISSLSSYVDSFTKEVRQVRMPCLLWQGKFQSLLILSEYG